MKCGLYDENYKIAADTNLLVNYLYNCHLRVAYLPEFVTRMRMGGMSTDSAKRKKVWDEDIRVYSGYGFKPVTLTKLMKMAWKVPQFILQVRPLNDLFVRQRNMNGKSSVNAVLCA